MRQYLRKWLAATAGMIILLSALPMPAGQAASPPAPTGPGAPCAPGAPVRQFDINAIEVDMTYNKYGLHDPSGKMYVLRENRQAVLSAVADNPGKTVSLVQPLAIRANVGDCIEIDFENELHQNASIHPTGVSYDVLGSDGQAVGYNPDSTAAPGQTITYRWYAEKEGVFFFDNGADLTYNLDPTGQKGTRSRGLFGALIVEPAGATWTHPRTGEPLNSGVQADIHLPDAPDFREIVIFYHDGNELEMQDGSKPVEPTTGLPAQHYMLNYRGDPDHLRYITPDCEDCPLQSQFYSSWVHGDPGGGDLVYPVYKGDPVKFRIVGAQTEENHVHHLHVHRWKADESDPESNTVDSQTIGPGMTYTQTLTGGAGYEHGAVGDILFHCHLFPHYFDGMWAMMRVHDKLQPDVVPLPDRDPLPAPTTAEPGYPHFIPGTTGLRPPKPADPELRPPLTQIEATALKAMVPGAPYVDPCPAGVPSRQYDITAIQLPIVMNSHGDVIPDGRIYVQTSDKAAVLSGQKQPEPLVLRANKGDCVNVTLRNELPSDQHKPKIERLDEISMHIHFVAFDVLGSDSTSVGYNYDEGILPGEVIRHRWWANEEGTIYFHDHQSHSAGQGAYGMLAVQPTGSKWVHPQDLRTPVTVGTKAVIIPPNAPSYREYALFYGDQVLAVDKNGKPYEPPPVPHAVGDYGTAAINYRSEQFWHRQSADPAYVFSSEVHDDPATPLIETYPTEPVKIRLITGQTEEMHNWVMHGLDWQRDPHQPDIVAQTISVSEQFNFNLTANPSGQPERDYLYGSMIMDDLWNGMWGLFRVWGTKVSWMDPLPETPRGTLTTGKLVNLTKTTGKPTEYSESNNPCPTGSPEKQYDVVAFQQEITFNRYGDYDPHGIIYALAENEAAIRSGQMPVEPMVLRANVGDCIRVSLTNKLPAQMEAHTDHARVLGDTDTWRNSSRISLHAQLVQYDVQTTDGAAVGWNYDTTVGPGQTKIYRWYAHKEVGATILWDMADPKSHRHHGAYGMLIIEPAGATYLDPTTGAPIKSGAIADIVVPGGRSFREAALTFADGAYIINPSGDCVVTDPEGSPSKPCNQQGDHEDQGFKAINYRSAPLPRRLPEIVEAEPPCLVEGMATVPVLVTSDRIWYSSFRCSDHGTFDRRSWSVRDGEGPQRVIFSRAIPPKHLIFSSYVHGDPDTPLLRAYKGDPVVIRLADTGDKARSINLHLAEHVWLREWKNSYSPYVSASPQITPGGVANIDLWGGAGGPRGMAGDFLYMDEKLDAYLEAGMWGIFRVFDYAVPELQPLPGQ